VATKRSPLASPQLLPETNAPPDVAMVGEFDSQMGGVKPQPEPAQSGQP